MRARVADDRQADFQGNRTNSTGAERRRDEAQDPPAHARSVACARRAVREKRRLQWLLVYVLEDRERLLQKAAREEQGGVAQDRAARPSPGLTRLRWRPGRGLVSADAPGDLAVAGSRSAIEARRRHPGLDALLPFCPQGLSQARRHVRPHRWSLESRQACA